MKLKSWLVGGVLLASFQSVGLWSGQKMKAPIAEAVPGEFVVKFRERSEKGIYQTAANSGLQIKDVINASEGLALVDLGAEYQKLSQALMQESAVRASAVAMLESQPEVVYAEPNFIYRTTIVDDASRNPDDADFSKLWGLHNSGQPDPSGTAGVDDADIDAPEAWTLSTGSRNVVVAVIDTGVDYNHPDLKNNMWTMPGRSGVHGYNAINDRLDPMDDHNHGTHCAGSIAAEGGNGIGVAGVSWQASIMGVKFLSASGSGTLANAVKSIDWATENGANIMSNSWGGGGFSESLKESIERAHTKGILFVAAAGNDSKNNDGSPSYPASYEVPNVVSVAASTNSDGLAYFSNFGKRTVHLMAPGHNILSTVRGRNYASYSGTSMATPHVSGAAALLLAHEPNLTHLELKERLLKTTDKVMAMRNKLSTRGGRLNVNNLLRNIQPSAPGDVPDGQWANSGLDGVSSAHPYVDNANQRWELKVEGATYMRLRFAKFETEAGYDKVILKDKSGNVWEEFSGNLAEGTLSDSIPGDTIIVEFQSDYSETRYGFDIDQIEATTWRE